MHFSNFFGCILCLSMTLDDFNFFFNSLMDNTVYNFCVMKFYDFICLKNCYFDILCTSHNTNIFNTCTEMLFKSSVFNWESLYIMHVFYDNKCDIKMSMII